MLTIDLNNELFNANYHSLGYYLRALMKTLDYLKHLSISFTTSYSQWLKETEWSDKDPGLLEAC